MFQLESLVDIVDMGIFAYYKYIYFQVVYQIYIYLHIYCRCIDSVCIHIKLHNTTTISSLNYLVIGIMKSSYTWSPITRTLGSPLIRHRLISNWYRLISNRRLSESLKPGLPRPSALGNECKKINNLCTLSHLLKILIHPIHFISTVSLLI